jgi:hypothetical protein
MKAVIQHETYGTIIFKETFFGKETLIINNEQLVQVSETRFRFSSKKDAPDVIVRGTIVTGVKMYINGEVIQLLARPTNTVLELSLAIILAVIVGGLCTPLHYIFPMANGFPGYLISCCFAALCAVTNIYITNKEPDPADKVSYSLCFLALAIVLSHVTAVVILAV